MFSFFKGKTIVISGISRGIGKAVALQASSLGMQVAGFDILQNELNALNESLQARNAPFYTEKLDVKSAEACAQFIENCIAQFGQIDILINNAGITHIAPEAETNSATIERLMHVNVIGLMHLSHYALPHLLKQKGSLVSLSSVAGFSPLLYRTSYAASKHAVVGYMSSLRAEMRDKEIQILTACPSYVKTTLQENQQAYFSNKTQEALTPEAVSEALFKAIYTKKELVLIGKTAKRVYWLNRFFPKLYEKIMLRKTRV